jgi:hypothetical protein
VIAEYSLWQYLHILLFAYWLGADLGVFLAARYVARGDLRLDERLRFLELLLRVDMGPRTALILMIPVGSTLAARLGAAAIHGPLLAAIWGIALLWLAVAWWIVLLPRHDATALLSLLDRWLRIGVVAGFAGVALLSMVRGTPIEAPWLAAKLLLFAGVVLLGLLLRGVLRDWGSGFAQLRAAEGRDDAARVREANALIGAAHRRSTPYAMLLWLLVAAIAFLGVTKPPWP